MMSALFALPVFAQQPVIGQDIRQAVNYAFTQGLCDREEKKYGDCTEETWTCDNSKWKDFVSENVIFNGSSANQKPGGIELPGSVYYFLSLDEQYRSAIPVFKQASCFCECNTNDKETACAGKAPGTPFQKDIGILYTREECQNACEGRDVASKCAGKLPSQQRVSPGYGTVSASTQAMCWQPEECAEADGLFESWEGCQGDRGRCYAQDPEITLNTQIGNVKTIRGVQDYIVTAYRYMLSVVGVVATVMFIWGAFMYLLGSAADKISKGKEIMIESVIGLLLVIGAVAILRTLNPATLQLNPLKVYMVNTAQFITAASCTDLPSSVKLADAGTAPNIASYESISSNPDNFTIAPSQTLCGHKYYIGESISDATCTGYKCEDPSEACVSCANGLPEDCNGKKSSKMVCNKQKFGGTIRYSDGRFPEQVYLTLVCNYAQPTGEMTLTEASSWVWQRTWRYAATIDKTNLPTGSQTVDVQRAGIAAYTFDNLDEDDIRIMERNCRDHGGFRGALLSVEYNDDVSYGARVIAHVVGIAEANFADDFAVLSKDNCGAGVKMFDGYASGFKGGWTDGGDISLAIACGMTRRNKFTNPASYWNWNELMEAFSGKRAISCDFALVDGVGGSNAPSNPLITECDPGPAVPAALAGEGDEDVPACAPGVERGSTCYDNGAECRTAANEILTCRVIDVRFGGQWSGVRN